MASRRELREKKTRFAMLSPIAPLSVRKRCVSLMMRRGRAAAAISTPRPARERRRKRSKEVEKR